MPTNWSTIKTGSATKTTPPSFDLWGRAGLSDGCMRIRRTMYLATARSSSRSSRVRPSLYASVARTAIRRTLRRSDGRLSRG